MTEFYDAANVPSYEVERRLHEAAAAASGERGPVTDAAAAGIRWAAAHWPQIVRVVRDLESPAGGGGA